VPRKRKQPKPVTPSPVRLFFFRNTAEVHQFARWLFKRDRDAAQRAAMPKTSGSNFTGENQKGVGAKNVKATHNQLCTICGRVTFHFLHSERPICSEHSSWPNPLQLSAHKLRMAGKATIKTGPDSDKNKSGPIPPMVRELTTKSMGTLFRGTAILSRLGIAPLPEQPKGLRCSYCHKVVEESAATHATGRLRRKIENVIVTVNGERTIEERIKTSVDRIVSCPDCVLNLSLPLYTNRDGVPVYPKLKYVQFD
jgi:hypothetical protein